MPSFNPVSVPITTNQRKTIDQNPDEINHDTYKLTTKDRLKGRSLQHVASVESLYTKCDDIAKDLHLLWCLGRNALSSDESDNETVNTDLPGFQAFTSRF